MTLFDLSRKESQPRNIIDSGYDMENVWNVISVTRETISAQMPGYKAPTMFILKNATFLIGYHSQTLIHNVARAIISGCLFFMLSHKSS